MGIERTVEWLLSCGPEDADARVRAGMQSLDMAPTGPPGQISGSTKRSLMKNRWASEVTVQISPVGSGSEVLCRIDQAGSKHFEIGAELAEAIGEELFDDRGAGEAIERMNKAGRVFGRKELRHLRNLLRSTERVAALGQGQYDGKQGLVVLTDARLFFFEKSLGSETIEEFNLAAISSLSVSRKMTGETLKFFASGNQAEIKNMMHGQADVMSSAFRRLLETRTATGAPPAPPVADDPIAQIERLAALRDKGIISSEEFDHKKADLLGRM